MAVGVVYHLVDPLCADRTSNDRRIGWLRTAWNIEDSCSAIAVAGPDLLARYDNDAIRPGCGGGSSLAGENAPRAAKASDIGVGDGGKNINGCI